MEKFIPLNIHISMLEKKRENLGKGGEWGAFFTDLSKDCLTQDLSLAKLNTSGYGY